MAIEKLNITVKSGEKAKASDFNNTTAKVDELVDDVNARPTVKYLTTAQMESLTASTAEANVIYISLEGYNGSTAWVLGGTLPIVLT